MRVCLGTPVLGVVKGEVYFSHLSLAVEIGRVCDIVIPGVMDISPHSRARQRIFDLALQNDCDMVFFLDSDMHPPLHTFKNMLATMMKYKAQMVSAHAYRRGFPFTSVWSKKIEGQWFQLTSDSDGTPEEIESTGLACNLIDLRWCKERLSEPYFYQDDKLWEDQYFCKKMLEAGGKIFAEPSVRCGHLFEGLVINDENATTLRKWSLGYHEEVVPEEGLENVLTTQAKPVESGNLPSSTEAVAKD